MTKDKLTTYMVSLTADAHLHIPNQEAHISLITAASSRFLLGLHRKRSPLTRPSQP